MGKGALSDMPCFAQVCQLTLVKHYKHMKTRLKRMEIRWIDNK